MDDFHIYKGDLPHWRETGVTYFVTWRIQRDQSPLKEYERTWVMQALLHFRDVRYSLDAFVIMDDHVHVLLCPVSPWRLEQLTHSWKSFTANRLQKNASRTGAVWQKESFDRIVRDEREWMDKIAYVAHNPIKRWPDLQEPYRWIGGDQFSI